MGVCSKLFNLCSNSQARRLRTDSVEGAMKSSPHESDSVASPTIILFILPSLAQRNISQCKEIFRLAKNKTYDSYL